MSLIGELFALLVAFLVGVFVRRYFIFASAPKKTNIPFVKKYNLLTGSNDIIFVNNKLMAENGHDRHKELGDTFGAFIGSYMQIFTRDVDLVYKVCVDNFRPNANKYYVNSLSPVVKASLLEARDQPWQTSRKAVGSVLKASKLKMDNVDTDIDQKIKAMLASINRRIAEKRSRGEDTILDAYQINKNFFMASILKIIYNQENMVDFDSDQNDVVEEMYKFVSVNYQAINRICFLIPKLNDIMRPTGSNDIIFVNNKLMAENGHDRHKELGDTFGAFIGSYMQIFTRDVDLVYKVCVDNFRPNANKYYVNSLSPVVKASLLEARDQPWQTSRKAVGSVLKASKLKMDNVDTDIDQKIKAMLASINRRIAEKRSRGEDTILDAYQINKNFFMASILKIIYNQENMVDFDSDQNDVVEEMYKFVSVNYQAINRICFLIPKLNDIMRPFIGLFDHGKYLKLLGAKLERILADNLSDVKEGKTAGGRLTTIHSLINSFRKGELTRLQLMGNAFFLMLAGFATTVDTMSALLWELARAPEVQKKLRDDLLQYGEDSKYLQQCINETLRLYPGSMTNRDIGEHTEHKEFLLPKGACMQISIYSIHRDPRLWGPDAEEWKPDRFDPSRAEKFHPAQFIPFGIGPRNCVGYNLARLEMSKLAAQFVLNYKFETCAETQSKLQFVPLGALPFALPIHGPVYLRITPTTES